ncbi:fumarylacetoacetate hydrolase family protein [Paracoccus aerodenitrificans]|uniref:fumarylacetoacetate hydrolase family protein n=1 Tax=Paracoccus aerodenitrificans TaxID=3017781 RepID=UPI0022F06ABE|nr:fumarylacetoacetate hydrolase family protein [Paracoccus aerodenitrificans]WBU64190.1 fumarylacetoacetate hydrolase family protein [Paracoccus aerodenitrificans]
MTDTLFPAPEWPTVPVKGATAELPVRRVFCVGRNYADHAAEMGVEVDREAPFYFTKSALTILPSGQSYPYPPGTENFHYEMEFVVAIGKPAFRISKEQALDVVYGYAAGLDMTRRDLQLAARAKQRPWDLGKDVEGSSVIAAITRAADFGEVADQKITLSVDGETRQDAELSDLVWSVAELVADLSKFYHLEPGDLIYTGTPAGVGAVTPGARIVGTVDGLDPVELTVGEAE